jgi:uncharacterized protein (DUF58 family)
VNPLWILLAAILPLAALGYWLEIYPRRTLVLALLAPTLFALGLLLADAVLAPLLAVDLAIGLVALADLTTLARRDTFAVERESGRIASLRQAHPVRLTVTNRSPREWRVDVRDDLPAGLEADPDRFEIRLSPQSRSTVHYQLKASRRGAFVQEQVYLRVSSRLGLWQRSLRFPLAARLHVYPDMQQLAKFAVLARADRLNLLGMRRTRRVGQDNEFERLRDFTRDDNFRFIDWRSTARRQKLTVKDFQANQSQRLVLLVDCGRMMANTSAGLSLLDHALNAMLMLAFVALRRGDAVGMVAFSDEIHHYVPPRSGMQQMNRLLHASFDRFPRLVESRYDEAFLYLASHARKRSLVILITNLIDEVNSHQVEQYLTNLVGRHLPLCVLLRDHQLFDAADAPLDADAALYRAAAAAEILTWRRQVLADLSSQGVLSLDVFPEQLTAPLVNRYLEIKARHLL